MPYSYRRYMMTFRTLTSMNLVASGCASIMKDRACMSWSGQHMYLVWEAHVAAWVSANKRMGSVEKSLLVQNRKLVNCMSSSVLPRGASVLFNGVSGLVNSYLSAVVAALC